MSLCKQEFISCYLLLWFLFLDDPNSGANDAKAINNKIDSENLKLDAEHQHS